MAGLNIGDVFMRVLADMTGFEADVTKGAQKAGDKAGQTLGQRMQKGMTKGFSAIGAGAGLVFGVAATGAAELTNAMAKFQAETGATQAEMESARKSVLALSSSNLQSFDEIAGAQAALRTQMGLTQEQAEASTESFLDFATATGQDATEAVGAFDDILDSWGLTADDATGIMDKLIASHQKYGGTIADNQKTLAALAPSLKAANFEIDDGIALLNLFGAKGLDANTASAAFAKALTKVKSPKELQDLIKDIAATENPFLRAQKAADLFGAKAGSKLGNALADANLDDYKVGMDEAAGATKAAADAIESTPFNQLKLALRGIAAPAIEAGQAFGPLLLALSQLGGRRLVTAVTTALGGIGGLLTSKMFGPKAVDAVSDGLADTITAGGKSSKVSAATTKLGSFLGTKLGKGLSVGFAAVAIFEVVETYNRIKSELAAQTEQIGADIGTSIATGSTEQLQTERAAVLKGLQDLYKIPDLGIITGDSKDALMAQIKAIDAELAKRGPATGEAVGANLKEGRGAVEAGAKTMLAPIKAQTLQAQLDAKIAAGQTPETIAAAILEKQGAVGVAMQALKNQMSSELLPWQQRARTIGQLVSTEVANGVNDKRPGVRVAAQNVRKVGEDELRKTIAAGGKVGREAMTALTKAMNSKDPDVRAAARRTMAIITNTKPNTKPAGVKAGQGVVAGLNSQKGPVGAAATALAQRVARNILSGIQAAGHRATHKGEANQGGGVVQAFVPTVINEGGQELFTPEVRGRVLTAADTRAILSAQNAERPVGVNVNLSTYGLPMLTETPADVASAIRRVGSMGLLHPRRSARWSTG